MCSETVLVITPGLNFDRPRSKDHAESDGKINRVPMGQVAMRSGRGSEGNVGHVVYLDLNADGTF